MFAGGIGERSRELREAVGRNIECLGFGRIDAKKNDNKEVKEGGVVVDISDDSMAQGKKVLVCKTDEQLEMARECALEEKFWK